MHKVLISWKPCVCVCGWGRIRAQTQGLIHARQACYLWYAHSVVKNIYLYNKSLLSGLMLLSEAPCGEPAGGCGGSSSGWSLFRTPHTCRASLRCGHVGGCAGWIADWSSYRTPRTHTASHRCGLSCGCGALSSGWSPSHTCHTWKVSHRYGRNDGQADSSSWWNPSRTCRICKVSQPCGLPDAETGLDWPVKALPQCSRPQAFSFRWSLWWLISSELWMKSSLHRSRVHSCSEVGIFLKRWPSGLVISIS